MMIYQTATDHINHRPYDLVTPSYYQPNLPDAYLSGEVAPIYTPIYVDARGHSRFPIIHMIDMFTNKVQFEIMEDKDVVSIFHMLDNYLVEVYPKIVLHQEQIARYASKVLAFRAVMYHRFRRVLNIHPDWRDAYKGGASGVLDVFEILHTVVGIASADPIEALRKPPYQLDDKHALVQPGRPASTAGLIDYLRA